MDVVGLEPLQFAVNVGFAAAEPVERLYDKRIAGAQHSRLERLIAGAVEVFAGLLIRDDFSVICAERAKGLELTIEILLARGNAGVVECFVHHITSKNVRKGLVLSGHFRLLRTDLFGQIFAADLHCPKR